jgi:hypothetical protein
MYHQFFFTTNRLRQQLTKSQFFQSLTLQRLVVVAADIHCVLSEYATQKNFTGMFSEDEY